MRLLFNIYRIHRPTDTNKPTKFNKRFNVHSYYHYHHKCPYRIRFLYNGALPNPKTVFQNTIYRIYCITYAQIKGKKELFLFILWNVIRKEKLETVLCYFQMATIKTKCILFPQIHGYIIRVWEKNVACVVRCVERLNSAFS